MKQTIANLLLAAALGTAILPTAALAADKPANPARQTVWDLYLTSREAHDMKQAQGDKVLFVDVRDPVEIM